MPTKAIPSNSGSINAASAARAAAHPYANARSNKRTTSVDEKPQLSPSGLVSPTELEASPTVRPKKKGGSISQPKSTRQQFSACHACRFRRVKCDLKEFSSEADPNIEVSCTNCRERGIRCKDDYADNNKRQLRRGKRINQLELEETMIDNADDNPFQSRVKPRVTIPTLKPEFFDSPFFRRFYVQRPIIDPIEFRSRYVAWLQHHLSPESNAVLSSAATPLSVEGQLIGKILVVWAAAYGVDESGIEQPENSHIEVQKRRTRVKSMIEEVMRLIDNLSLLRKPSWDGVRCLLLTLPLTEDVLSNPMDRLSMYECAIQQVYTLCQHDGVLAGATSESRAANALVRARIFWYAHVHEGLTTGLRGGRLLMDDDDLRLFHKELPRPAFMGNRQALQTPNMNYSFAFQYAAAPIRLASACRKVHAALTGPKARAARRLDGQKLEDTWEALALCWEEFENLRPIQRSDYIKNEDSLRFVDGWQIFLFECYNVIQEKIRERLDSVQAAQITEWDEDPDSPATVETLVRDLKKYLAIAETKCYDLLDHVVLLIRRHLGSSFFAYDASLVRDGCFFAGHTLALMPGRDEDVKACLQALSEMRWAFSKGHERSQTIRLAWGNRADRQEGLATPSSERVRSPGESPESGQAHASPAPLQPPPRAPPPTHNPSVYELGANVTVQYMPFNKSPTPYDARPRQMHIEESYPTPQGVLPPHPHPVASIHPVPAMHHHQQYAAPQYTPSPFVVGHQYHHHINVAPQPAVSPIHAYPQHPTVHHHPQQIYNPVHSPLDEIPHYGAPPHEQYPPLHIPPANPAFPPTAQTYPSYAGNGIYYTQR
ncbi:hypothetical protein FRC17_004179 [Serendipita sp. 399]|nr:hypothetical protein FRC17_004179 [Serendipita sp. 399]